MATFKKGQIYTFVFNTGNEGWSGWRNEDWEKYTVVGGGLIGAEIERHHALIFDSNESKEITAHRLSHALWRWLALNPGKGKEDWPLWTANGGPIEPPRWRDGTHFEHLCFLCTLHEHEDYIKEEVKSSTDCDKCCLPDCNKVGSLWKKWICNKTPENATAIANIIEAKLNELLQMERSCVRCKHSTKSSYHIPCSACFNTENRPYWTPKQPKDKESCGTCGKAKTASCNCYIVDFKCWQPKGRSLAEWAKDGKVTKVRRAHFKDIQYYDLEEKDFLGFNADYVLDDCGFITDEVFDDITASDWIEYKEPCQTCGGTREVEGDEACFLEINKVDNANITFRVPPEYYLGKIRITGIKNEQCPDCGKEK